MKGPSRLREIPKRPTYSRRVSAVSSCRAIMRLLKSKYKCVKSENRPQNVKSTALQVTPQLYCCSDFVFDFVGARVYVCCRVGDSGMLSGAV
jgi:hypothetical protein